VAQISAFQKSFNEGCPGFLVRQGVADGPRNSKVPHSIAYSAIEWIVMQPAIRDV